MTMPVLAVSFNAGAHADSDPSTIWARPIDDGAGRRAGDSSSSSTEMSFEVVPGPTSPTPTSPAYEGTEPGDPGSAGPDSVDSGSGSANSGSANSESANSENINSEIVDSGGSGPAGHRHVGPGHVGPSPVGPAPTGDPSLPFTGIDGRRLAIQALVGAGAVLVGAYLIWWSVSRRRRHGGT
ncbi:hypothetical protein [Streptosporangium sp. NPDC087985]|uniref:hypothetical protein n=1 Tax=Streptosporangium sp. NPDC087985 TaxID=3366196 RepID=UPI003827C86D